MPTAKERELVAQWERLMKAHSKPLERGAKAKGVRIETRGKKPALAPTEVSKRPSRPVYMGSATKPAVDPLAEAKKQLMSRVGQAYNKGGLQLLTDAEIAEQKTGSHRRR